MREDRIALGPSADVPGVRRHPLLRQLTESPRQQACPRQPSSRGRLGRARGTLAVLFPRRRLRGVLTQGLLKVSSFFAPQRNPPDSNGGPPPPAPPGNSPGS